MLYAALLVCVSLLTPGYALSKQGARDLLLAFRKDQSHHVSSEAAFMSAIDHDQEFGHFASSKTHIACSSYAETSALREQLTAGLGPQFFHPSLVSPSSDRTCYAFSAAHDSDIMSALLQQGFSVSTPPTAMKFDRSVERTAERVSATSAPFVLEISLGIGAQDKATSGNNLDFGEEVLHRAQQVVARPSSLHEHWKAFFFTSAKFAALDTSASRRRERFMSSALSSCSFSSVSIQASRSHVTLTGHPDEIAPACMVFLGTAAVAHPDVISVSANPGIVIPKTNLQSITAPYANDPLPYTDANSTDQNAWVQSGNSIDTPYNDIGIDGSTYVVGYIDSGADDLSCFLIDSTGEPTTRTPHDDYATPITEYNRRKVIQYVAWGDGNATAGYDHGTWCGGAVVGNCYDEDAHGETFNGVAYNAKMTMFDVDNKGDFVDVPSLYHISLPPSYEAGARVHSDSWGTPGMNAYTSKSLDVDEFMYENSDFLFVVAAANDGDYGYHSVGSPGVSKNALTVGATAENHDELVYFSSIGSDYDGMIKPNIVAPGTKLYSAGVRTASETDSCNVQISSGTSMATPMVAGTAVLVRHYMENASYWGANCNTDYPSCPVVNPERESTFISGSLLKAILVNSAKGISATQTSSHSVLPAYNLTTPPDVFQGWGQVLLSNVLPIAGVYDFDLFVDDYVSINSLSRTTYFVDVFSTATPFRATICWTDPVNVVWAAKNLLNDLDLTVISPTGQVYYGNGIQGDEYNPLERVVIDTPEIGLYLVVVTAKVFAGSDAQDYSIVITSDGTVDVAETITNAITVDDIYNQEETVCESSGKKQFVRFQLEDWLTGSSWVGVNLNIAKSNKKNDPVYQCTFAQNSDTDSASFNRISQCKFCMEDNTNYVVSFDASSSPNASGINMGANSPQCGTFLSMYQQSANLKLSKGECNACPNDSNFMTVTMYANVTDDDYQDYSWYFIFTLEAYVLLIVTYLGMELRTGRLTTRRTSKWLQAHFLLVTRRRNGIILTYFMYLVIFH